VMLMIPPTASPSCCTCKGLCMPTSNGPMISALPRHGNSLQPKLAAYRLGKIGNLVSQIRLNG
jgi:hypothetical protein